VVDGASGGVEQLLIGLASSLGKLDGEESYVFLGLENHDAWLRSYLGQNSEIRLLPGAHVDSDWKKWMRAKFPHFLHRWYPLRRRLEGLKWALSPQLAEPENAESLLGPTKADVIHLPHCGAVHTSLPVVYEPHDLQHIHLPENFIPRARAERDRNIRLMVANEATFAVASTWVKNDLIRHFGMRPGMVHVVPLAPPLAVYRNPSAEDLRALTSLYHLPNKFAFYPAQTWPHKNHKVLLEAASILQGRNLTVPLVFSGQLNQWSSSLRLLAGRLGIASQVHFLGFVPAQDLFGLFRLAYCVAIPTLFEAASFPMWEAFLAGTPVICSDVTSLPAQSGGAARHFNPHDPTDVANALEEVMDDGGSRNRLIAAGFERVRQFTWERTAQMFRGLYRIAAGRTLSDDERSMLDATPIM
jgi:glycosyltransferase involved in cell wall biosynthesis